jgi:hypothetical protein
VTDTPRPPEQHPPGQHPPAQPYGTPGAWGNPFDVESTPILVTGILQVVAVLVWMVLFAGLTVGGW